MERMRVAGRCGCVRRDIPSSSFSLLSSAAVAIVMLYSGTGTALLACSQCGKRFSRFHPWMNTVKMRQAFEAI